MKILAINWRDPFHPEAGGAEVHLDKMLSFLAKEHDVTLITTRVKNEVIEYTHNEYKIYRWGHPFLFNFHFFILWQKLKREPFDLIIDDISKIGCMTPLYIKKIPIVGIFHHIHGKTLYKVLPFLVAVYVYIMEKIALLSYRKTPMVVVSESTKQELLELGKFEKLHVITNGIEEDFFEQKRVQKKSNQICFVGRLVAYKRLDLALKIFSYVVQKIPTATFIIAGKGIEEERLKQQAKELSIDHAVKFLGYIDEIQKIQLFRESEIFLFTSEKEGWGITALEASASQTPVFGFDVPGLRDSVKNGINGYLFEFENIEKISQQIIEYLLSDDKFVLENKALCYAKNFNWERICQEFYLYCLNEI